MNTTEEQIISPSLQDEIKNLTLDDIQLGGTSTAETEASDDVSGGDESASAEGDVIEKADEQSQEKSDAGNESAAAESSEKTEAASSKEENSEAAAATQVNTEELISNALNDAFGIGSIADLKAELDSRTILKDDFIKKAVEYYEKHSTLKPFLEATQVDYDKMSDEQILKMKHAKDNEGLPQKALDKRFAELMKKYNQDEDADDEDREIGKEEMTYDANKIRETLKAEQISFLEPVKDQQEQQQQEEKVDYTPIISNMLAKDIIPEGKFSTKIDNTTVNFDGADAQAVAAIAVDPEGLNKLFVENGKVNWNRLARAIYFIKNEEGYNKTILDSGKSLGRTDLENELKNSTQGKQAQSKPSSSAIDWDNPDFNDPAVKEAFLNAALEQRR